MPKKAKKPRPKKPWQKLLDFVELYKAQCVLFDVPKIDEVEELYNPIIEKKGKKIPQIIQFADMKIQPIQLRPLIEAYKKSEFRVKIFSLLNTETGDEGLHVLEHIFDEPMEVVGFAYHANKTGPSGCRALARGFVRSKFLSILELDFNPTIGDEGIAGLTYYGHCPTLSRLSLKFCDIGDAGATFLGRWIADGNCKIKELYLNGNKIGPIGAIAFAEELGRNNSLNRVELNDNVFGYSLDAMNALHDGIASCPTLQYVSLLNNFEVPEGIPEKFCELVQSKPLGECVLTVKMDTFFFQNMKAYSLTNKRKMVKEAKRLAREARKNKGTSTAPPTQPEGTTAPASANATQPTTQTPSQQPTEAPSGSTSARPTSPAPSSSLSTRAQLGTPNLQEAEEGPKN
ncbi:hypothetical protein TVAG_364170 [Trichomonas vaginalis G3]|uniref:Leucine Rich Repeat family protein n=1 Tax=Trichomonas vaginalis (strain ATCC PRA-98 / G3) TaxID=412133 RepID=A2E9D0_TRIV3|nr:Ran GTPase-activating protein 1 family [Trichomonas vaginalis G3]EAY10694.1 hypothetical protein TVAG_364170 [Trichomonas vaginalis G3]KAI5538587.1 Ran GTPase-activating protein 1 family [Trichomonas vaginalis G3]|eukprot:XP_001322917.1 hypothetical protein [Trichomonas vaginalis G3]